jgi:divalent metal cation (Fe/Co/Zn/Cd) transporter
MPFVSRNLPGPTDKPAHDNNDGQQRRMVPAEALSDQSPARVSRIVLMVNVALMTTQISAGWLTGSNAIVADGVHTTVDLVIDAILFASLRTRTNRGSWLPSAIVATLLTLTGAELLWQGVVEVSDAQGADTSVQLCALFIAMMVIVTRACVARHLTHVSGEMEATHAHAADVLAAGAWHARIDAISACAAALGALGTLAGFAHLDQLATVVIGGMMFCMGLLHEGGFIRLGYRFVR